MLSVLSRPWSFLMASHQFSSGSISYTSELSACSDIASFNISAPCSPGSITSRARHSSSGNLTRGQRADRPVRWQFRRSRGRALASTICRNITKKLRAAEGRLLTNLPLKWRLPIPGLRAP